ncbi:nuclear segregation protein Bfr1p [Monosporozyma servazzii]
MSSTPKGNNNRNFIKRPDVSIRDKKLETLNVQLKKVDQEVSLIRKQIDQYQVNDKTSNSRKSLLDENKEIIKTQANLKNRRNTIHDSIKQLDTQIKRRTNEINDKLGKKTQYNSLPAAKQRISEIEDIIGSGDLSIVEEKMMVKEMQSLNKLMKDLALIEPIKKAVDSDKAKIAELKEELNSLNTKEISNKFEQNQKKLDELQSSSQVVYDKRQTLFNKRTALYKKRDEIYAQIRQIRADFDNEFKSFKNKLEKERLKREEDELLSKVLEQKEDALSKLEEKLTHAKVPAFTYEIEAIENSLVLLDPTFEKPKRDIMDDFNDLALDTKTQIRPVEADDLVMVEKKVDAYSNTAPSKSKKHKKKGKSKATQGETTIFSKVDGKFSLEPTFIATLAELDITVPISNDDVPKTVEQLKSKLEECKNMQDDQTVKNIAEAEKAIEECKAKYEAKEEKIKKDLEAKRSKEQEESEKNDE